MLFRSLIGNVAHAPFERFELLAVHFLRDDLGTTDLHFETLAAHRLDEHGQLQFTSTGDLHHFGRIGGVQLDRDVSENFLVQSIEQVTTREELAVAAREGRVTLALQAERATAHEDYDRQVRDACLGMED